MQGAQTGRDDMLLTGEMGVERGEGARDADVMQQPNDPTGSQIYQAQAGRVPIPAGTFGQEAQPKPEGLPWEDGFSGVEMVAEDDSVFTPELADEAAAAAEAALATMRGLGGVQSHGSEELMGGPERY